jgi:signal transduction histidine kinase
VTAKSDRTREQEARIVELEARLARAEKTARALQDVGLALGSTIDLDQLLELILGKITELLEGDRATLYLLDEQQQRLVSRIMVGEEVRSIELPIGEGIAGHVAKVGKTARVKDAYRDRRFQRGWDEVTGYRTRSILAAPMKNHVGRTIGVVQVLNKRGGNGEFSEHDEELLTALATHAAVSIDNSRLFLSVIQKNMQLVETKEQLERKVSDLKLLFELESAMGKAATMEDLARAVIGEAARACRARAGALLVDEDDGGLWLYFVDTGAELLGGSDSAGAGHAPEAVVLRVAMKRSEGVIARAMTHNEALILPATQDVYRTADTRMPSEPPSWTRADRRADASRRLHPAIDFIVTSAIAVPLEGADENAVGAVALYNSRAPGGFSRDDRALLRVISANASTAVRLFRSRIEREQSERLTSIGRLLSGVMHDMRTPLTVISGNVQLMATANDPAVRAEHARLILKQFDVISAMQREVLEFARGERSILVRKVYLTKFFGDMEKQLGLELEGTGVTLRMELDDRGVARFDEAKMTRVLHNLVRNAVEAMAPSGGTLTIRAFREGNELMVSVSDTGKGIPKEIQQRLFRSFVTSGKAGGTGLGLAIVKKIVDEHSGTISVSSSDQGATFTIRLPQDTPSASTRPPGAAPSPRPSETSRRPSNPGR